MRKLIALALPLVLTHCAAAPPDNEQPARATAPTDHNNKSASSQQIQWFEDDFPAARARAQRDGQLVIMQMWAAWCGPCIEMKHSVLRSPQVEKLGKDFIFLRINTEIDAAKPVLAQFTVASWPTFYIFDPNTLAILGYQSGGLSPKSFVQFVHAAADRKTAPAHGPNLWVRKGDQAQRRGDYEGARKAYIEALKVAPAAWSQRERIEGELSHLGYLTQRPEECLAQFRKSPKAATASWAAFCATLLPADSPVRKEVLAETVAILDKAASAPEHNSDTRAEILHGLWQAQRALGNSEQATKTAKRWLAQLEKLYREISDPLDLVRYNWPIAQAYVAVGRGADAIPLLRTAKTRLPASHDPPMRLAWVLSKLGRHREALVEARLALPLATGITKPWIHALLARLHHKLGDHAAQLVELQATADAYKALPPGMYNEQSYQSALAALKRARQAKPD